jgi:3-oxoacyl-[acyl-carrier protein] reductase
MSNQLSEDIKEKYITAIPLRRAGTPSEVANVVCFLSSDMAKYITGQVIHIDGGLVM